MPRLSAIRRDRVVFIGWCENRPGLKNQAGLAHQLRSIPVEAGRAAGMRVLGFGEELDADLVFTDMTELPDLLHE